MGCNGVDWPYSKADFWIFGFLDFWNFLAAVFGASNFLKPHRCKWRQKEGGCVLWQWWQFLMNNTVIIIIIQLIQLIHLIHHFHYYRTLGAID